MKKKKKNIFLKLLSVLTGEYSSKSNADNDEMITETQQWVN